MGVILCATRGGEASVRSQQAAIALARQAGDELVFVYIYDVEFLAHANYALHEDVVEEELDRMAEFLMSMAIDRARTEGVAARAVIRHGQLPTELLATMEAERPRMLVLGRPGAEAGRFALEHLAELASGLQEATGIPVRILPE